MWIQLAVPDRSQAEWTLRWGDRNRAEGLYWDWYPTEFIDTGDEWIECALYADQVRRNPDSVAVRVAFRPEHDRALLESLVRLMRTAGTEGALPAVFSLKPFHSDWRETIMQPGEPTQLYALKPESMLERMDELGSEPGPSSAAQLP